MSSQVGHRKCDLVLVAGGAGVRYDSSLPKQFDNVNGRPLYTWALDTFLNWPVTGNVVIVVPESWVAPVRESLKILKNQNDIRVVAGGSSRQMSATLGLKALNEFSQNHWVMVHDGARPAFTDELLQRLWNNCQAHSLDKEFGGVIPGLAARETIKLVEQRGTECIVKDTLPRQSLFMIQTPQCLRRDFLQSAYEEFQGEEAIDDACLLEKMGMKILMVDGEYENIKITFVEDKERVSHWLRQRHPQI